MDYDYLIIGQGLCGTLLARQLILAGMKVIIVDDGRLDASSRVAGGLVNPVTGKRLVRSWMIEELLATAIEEYSAIGTQIGEKIIHITDIVDCHTSSDDKHQFRERAETESRFLKPDLDTTAFNQFFNLPFGAGQINPALHIRIEKILTHWRSYLISEKMIAEKTFRLEECTISYDQVSWKGIKSKGIIFCDGEAANSNPYFNRLPWSKDKGEILIAAIPDLAADRIYRHGHVSIMPWLDGLFWVGASHDWKYEMSGPSEAFRTHTISILDKWLKIPFRIVDHLSSLRPANFDRKPFIGFHPAAPNVGIFNGMGGKGFSMAPYFAKQFAAYITEKKPLLDEVSIERYRKILTR